MEPDWLTFARRFIGREEVLGPDSNPWIVELWYKLKAGWLWLRYRDDSSPELAWCGLFVASCFHELGYKIPTHFYRARAWLDWGIAPDVPVVGCVVVFDGGPKRPGAGHVGFLVGIDQNGNLMVLSGNAKNRVGIDPYSSDRVLGYRIPDDTVVIVTKLPLIESGAKVSTNEA